MLLKRQLFQVFAAVSHVQPREAVPKVLSKIVWFVVPDRISQIDISMPESGIESSISMQGSWEEVANLALPTGTNLTLLRVSSARTCR